MSESLSHAEHTLRTADSPSRSVRHAVSWIFATRAHLAWDLLEHPKALMEKAKPSVCQTYTVLAKQELVFCQLVNTGTNASWAAKAQGCLPQVLQPH